MKKVTDGELKQSYLDAHRLSKHFSSPMIDSMQLKKFYPGEYLTAQGTKLSSLYLLVEGKLQVEHYEKDGNRAVFSFENAFTVIGDLELFQDSETETVSTVRAITDVYALEIPLAKVQQYGLEDSAFLRFICRQLSNKLYASAQFHSNSAFRSVFKVRKYLAFRAEAEGNIIQLEKREAIAAMLGVSVRQLNRALKEIAEQGLIQLKNKTVKVLDNQALSDISPTDF